MATTLEEGLLKDLRGAIKKKTKNLEDQDVIRLIAEQKKRK